MTHGPNSYVANTGVAMRPTLDPLQTMNIENSQGERVAITFHDSLQSQYGAFTSQFAARVRGDLDGTHLVPIGPPVQLDDFKDGQGNTVLFSESLHVLPWHRSGFIDREDLLFTDNPAEVFFPEHSRFTNGLVWHPVDWASGKTAKPIHQLNGTIPGGDSVVMTSTNAADLARPSSHHLGGVNAGMADGATRYISDSIDMRVWNALLTPRGRERVGEE